MTKKIAVVHGRFQPMHNGHLERYVMKAVELSKCSSLYVGITNSDEAHIKPSISNPDRSKPQNNPLNFIERFEMIKLTLLDRGLKREQFEIIPFPINRLDLLHSYQIENANYYLTIFDQWGKDKLSYLVEMFGKDNVHSIPVTVSEQDRIKAVDIRNNMKNGTEWEHLVPRSVSKYLKSKNLVDKIV